MKAVHIQQLLSPRFGEEIMLAVSQNSSLFFNFILHEMWEFGEGRHVSINGDM